MALSTFDKIMKFLKLVFGLAFVLLSVALFGVMAYVISFMAMFAGISQLSAIFLAAAALIYLNFVLFFGSTIFNACVVNFFSK